MDEYLLIREWRKSGPELHCWAQVGGRVYRDRELTYYEQIPILQVDSPTWADLFGKLTEREEKLA
jgi:hypothetical protein